MKVLVSGAGSGIGAAIAKVFAAQGDSVAVVDVNGDRASHVAAELNSTADANRAPAIAAPFTVDVTSATSVRELVDAVERDFGDIDVLVNSAGVVFLGPAATLSENDWDQTLDVNLKGAFLMSQAFGSRMVERGSGRVISIASQAGTVALDQHVAYCASKAGLMGMTRVLALEWGPSGVTANTVSPTVVLTELGKKAWDNPAGEAHKAQIPRQRFALPEEVAAAVLFLASPGADMVTGTDLKVDGGFTIQ